MGRAVRDKGNVTVLADRIRESKRRHDRQRDSENPRPYFRMEPQTAELFYILVAIKGWTIQKTINEALFNWCHHQLKEPAIRAAVVAFRAARDAQKGNQCDD